MHIILCSYQDDATSSTLESLFSCFCTWDPRLPGCPFTSVSPGFETSSGYSSQDLLGRSSKLLQGSRTEPEAVAAIAAALETRGFASTEITLHKKDAKMLRDLLCVVPVLDAGAMLVGVLEVHCDLDEKSKREVVDEHFINRWCEQVRLLVEVALVRRSRLGLRQAG